MFGNGIGLAVGIGLAAVAVIALLTGVLRPQEATFLSLQNQKEKRPSHLLRVATYNIHIGKDPNNRLDLEGTIETLRRTDADIIGLQEVEKNGPRTMFVDQARHIAAGLGMEYRFEGALKVGPFEFGNALLSKFPILATERIELPSDKENRVALLATLDVYGKATKVLVTHLGLEQAERVGHVREIDKRLGSMNEPVIVMGDLNAQTHAAELKPWMQRLKQTTAEPLTTFPGLGQIDHILVSPEHFEVRKAYTIQSGASDHLPLVTDVAWK